MLARLRPALLTSALRRPLSTARPPRAMAAPAAPAAAKTPAARILASEAQVRRSPADDRLYRVIELDNQLRLVLVHDAQADKSAATAAVGVGSLSNPRHLPGLAHFLEHMLFLGTAKFPVENDYHSFVQQHGGHTNAYTSDNATVYYFDVGVDHLAPALDRFAQFFISPLLNESATEREVNAVDSEHSKNLDNDGWRLRHLDCSLSDPSHPFSLFSTGSLETLWNGPRKACVNVREELLNFHRKYYSANLITVAVYGRESLDELQTMATQLFNAVPNYNVSRPTFDSSPFRDVDLAKMIKAVSIKDSRHMTITFPVPDVSLAFKTQPGHYVSHLIGHEGPGSLLSYLKARDWAQGLSAGNSTGSVGGFGFFRCGIDLTETGLQHVDEVLLAFFQYVEMMRRQGPQPWIFEELKDMAQMQFRFKDKGTAASNCLQLANALQHFPAEHIVDHSYALTTFDPAAVDDMLNRLRPEHARVMLAAKAFEADCTETEPIYGTKYTTVPLSADLLKRCTSVEPSPEIRLPLPNEFIPTDFSLISLPDPAPDVPQIVRDDAFATLWHKFDPTFKLPKASAILRFVTPAASTSPRAAVLTALTVRLLKDALTEIAYNAELSGLAYEIYGEITLAVHGYNDKLFTLLNQMVDSMLSLQPTQQRFKDIYDAHRRSLLNFSKEQPAYQASNDMESILVERHYDAEQCLQALQDITYEETLAWPRSLFRHVYIEGLVQGNISPTKALTEVQNVVDGMSAKVASQPCTMQERQRRRQLQVPAGTIPCVLRTCDMKISAYQQYIQFGPTSKELSALSILAQQMISEPFFDVLRTKEQLGYVVNASQRSANGTEGIKFLVQSDTAPSQLHTRVQRFLTEFVDKLPAMSEEEFERHKKACLTKLLDKPKSLRGEVARHWHQITVGHYFFRYGPVLADMVKDIDKARMVDFFLSYIYPSGDHRRAFIASRLGVKAHDESQELLAIRAQGINVLDNIPSFVARSSLHPEPQPLAAKEVSAFNSI